MFNLTGLLSLAWLGLVISSPVAYCSTLRCPREREGEGEGNILVCEGLLLVEQDVRQVEGEGDVMRVK